MVFCREFSPLGFPASGWGAALLALVLVGGCWGRALPEVTGKVTLNGQPVTHGTVTFIPRGGGPLAYGDIQPDGSYRLGTTEGEGLAAGEYIATVISTADPVPGPPGSPPAAPPLLTPAKYASERTSDLRVTVNPGPNTIDLPMTGAP